MSAVCEVTVVRGQHGRPGHRRASRYSLAASPPPELKEVLQALIKEAPRRGYTAKKMIMATLASAVRLYRVKGKCDDLLRLLRDHGVVLNYVEISGKRFFVDTAAAELMLLALEEKADMPLPTEGEMQRRLEYLIAYSKKPVRIVSKPLAPPAAVPVQESLDFLPALATAHRVYILEDPDIASEFLTEAQMDAYERRLIADRRKIDDELERLKRDRQRRRPPTQQAA